MKHLPFALFIFLITGCLSTCYQQASISQIKSLPVASIPTTNKYVITGYYNSDPVPMLISDTTWLHVNTPMPDSAFLVLSSSPALEKLLADPDQYYGALVKVRGTIQRDTLHLPGDSTIRIQTQMEANSVVVVNNPPAGSTAPTPIDLCAKYPTLCVASTTLGDNQKYALLYSGGCDANNAKIRYWNDLAFMYRTLLNIYGYPVDHILVVYKGGTPENSNMPVNYAASPYGLDMALSDLRGRLNGQDQLLVFTTNHGGGYDANEHKLENGLDDVPGYIMQDEPETTNQIDETIYYYYPSGSLRDEEFAAKLNSLTVGTMITLNQPCYSGGLLWDLRYPNRINISAAGEFEKSWSHTPSDNYDAFSYYFIAAMNGRTYDNKPLPPGPNTGPFSIPNPANADSNLKISVLEAFLYAKSQDNSSEHWLDDDGSGFGTQTPISLSGRDGNISSNVYF